MSGEFIPGVSASNTREHKVRTFLSKPPKRSTRLVLAAVADEGTAIVLGEWQRDEVVPTLSTHVIELLEEHAQEMGGAVSAELTYFDADNGKVTSMVLKRQANQIENVSDLAVQAMQGDARSLVVQAQAQSLMVQKLYLNSMGQVLTVSQQIAARANDQAEGYLRRIVDLEHEKEGLEEALRAAEEVAQAQVSGETAQVSEAQARAMKLLETLAPMVMQRLLSAGPIAPPAPPS